MSTYCFEFSTVGWQCSVLYVLKMLDLELCSGAVFTYWMLKVLFGLFHNLNVKPGPWRPRDRTFIAQSRFLFFLCIYSLKINGNPNQVLRETSVRGGNKILRGHSNNNNNNNNNSRGRWQGGCPKEEMQQWGASTLMRTAKKTHNFKLKKNVHLIFVKISSIPDIWNTTSQ